ncbi:hypothetical protein SKAU_G00348950 [Synaphobranchus kaupii]|uniref:Uncharacterized protein n=1 Tax=Synaphobranchus kaupii TaxID=118154 RepID=A0A9Q1IHR8_SYNKA|nr:hypothetical protein SKAU_G00348950 [Synaphobranchus kaupii]
MIFLETLDSSSLWNTSTLRAARGVPAAIVGEALTNRERAQLTLINGKEGIVFTITGAQEAWIDCQQCKSRKVHYVCV